MTRLVIRHIDRQDIVPCPFCSCRLAPVYVHDETGYAEAGWYCSYCRELLTERERDWLENHEQFQQI